MRTMIKFNSHNNRMNITRLNLRESLPLLKDAIARAHFLSFDLEMSGIQTEELTSPSPIDSIQKRYEKQKQSIDKFVPLQFGLSAFEILPERKTILASPFNFYIFPLTQPFEPMRFTFHAGTMNFLTKNQFDFNKLFYEAIPFTSKEKLRFYQKQDNIDSLREELRRIKFIQSPEVKAFLKLNLPVIEQWIVSDSPTIDINIAYMKYHSYTLLKQKVEAKYPTIPLVFEFDSEQTRIRSKMTIRKSTQQEKLAIKSSSSSLIESSGLFNEVFDQIVTSRKPLIVHNGFYDMMHIYYRFLEDLPPSWMEYRQKVHNLFPNLYDNKYLFANSPTLNHKTSLKMTGLENCFLAMKEMANKEEEQGLSDRIKIEISENFKQYSLDSLECHEAGFDSLMTGYAFLKGVTHLSPDLNILVNAEAFHAEQELIRNRIPLGSIKIPFNFEVKQEDIYTKDANLPIFFQSIMNQVIQQRKVCEYFSQNYGPVNFYWTARNMTEFCIAFISQQAKDKFLNEIKSMNNTENCSLFKLQERDFLVLTYEQHQRKMNNLIKIQKPSKNDQ